MAERSRYPACRGSGTTVVLQVPCRGETASGDDGRHHEQRAHILVVDDEINIRGALVTMLEKKGHQVRGVGTGEEALEQLGAAPAELVITDLRMPGIGGMEFLRRLKDKWPDTEVVVMTAYGSIDTAVEAMRCGAYDYLTKPIDRERFPIVGRQSAGATRVSDREQAAPRSPRNQDALRSNGRRERAHAARLQPGGHGGGQRRHGLAHGRKRNRQGTRCPGDPSQKPPGPTARSSR